MSNIVLPTTKIKAEFQSPNKLIIFSKPKVGKSSALAQLENSLILDLEKGTDFLDACKLQASNLEEIKVIGTAIIEAGRPYKYLIVDTITKLEDMVLPLAAKSYRETPIGKNWKGEDSEILNLPNGAGYSYLRTAFFKVLDYLYTLAPRVILVGHLKAKYLEKDGKEVVAAELDLVGKLKSMVSADVDAIGLLYREGNKTILSFKTTNDVICGARPVHLRNEEFVLAEMSDDNKLTTNWDKIYID